MKILLTRPEPGASATARRLEEMGLEPVLLPCLRITKLPAALPERPAAILVTSGQAIPMLPRRYHALPAFCVGDATAARMREAGFTRAESAAGDAENLARLVIGRRLPGRHLLAVGKGHGVGLASRLRAAGIEAERCEVYAAAAIPVLPAEIRAALAAGEIAKALFYSAETARAFIGMAPPGTAGLEALTLSANIAEALAPLPWRAIRVALAPSEADLLTMLG